MELIVMPITFIGWFILKIVEYSMSIHLVVGELSLVISTVIKHEFAFAMFLAI